MLERNGRTRPSPRSQGNRRPAGLSTRARRMRPSLPPAPEKSPRSHSSSLDLLASHYRRLDPISERHLGARLLRRGGSALIFAIIGGGLGASDSTGRMSNDLVTPRRGLGRRVASGLTRAMPSTVPASNGRCRCATPLEPVELDRSHRATPDRKSTRLN